MVLGRFFRLNTNMNIGQLSDFLDKSRDGKNTVASADRLNEIVQRVVSEQPINEGLDRRITTDIRTRKVKVSPHKESFKAMVDQYL